MTEAEEVAVLGAGDGGLGIAAYLAERGHPITLWNRSLERIARIQKTKKVVMESTDGGKIMAHIEIATTNLSVALARTLHVLVVVAATAHSDVARLCAPHLRDGHSILLLPGRTGGVLAFKAALACAGCKANVLLGEANSLPIASRSIAPDASLICGVKSQVLVASFPSTSTHVLLQRWRPILPMLQAGKSVLQTGLANFGAIIHPIIFLLNIDRIRKCDPFDFYTDGVTPEAERILCDADAERMSIAAAYGAPACTLQEWIELSYGHRATSLREALRSNATYANIRSPASLAHRYILEDVPTGIVPMVRLGDAAGLELPVLRGLERAARAVEGAVTMPQGRTLETLGLDGLSSEQIRRLVGGDSGR